MPWTKENPPIVAKNWTPEEQVKCVSAANSVLKDTGDDKKAIFACIHAAGKSKEAMARAATVVNGYADFTAALNSLSRLEFAEDESIVEAEIFAVGTWNKVWKFSLKDLKDIVANFSALSENHKVPLKLGHNDAQPFTDGQPALGWVTNVWVSGDKLMARFDNVPKIIRQAFASKMYRHVSVELDVDVEHKGKKYKYVLSAVALLGADTPAVNTLADLTHYLDGGERLAASRREVFSAISGDRKEVFNNDEDTEMTKEELDQAIKAALAPFETKIATFSTENATLRAENAAMKAEKTKLAEEADKVKIKMHRESLIGKLEEAVKDKRLVPAQRESAIKFMKLNDDAVIGVDMTTVEEYIKVNGGKARMSNEQGRNRHNNQQGPDDQDPDSDGKDPGEEITVRAKKLQGENANLTFSTARNRVMEADPTLAKSWLNGVGE